MSDSRTKYSKEYKMEAAKLALDDGRTAKSVSEDLGINYQTLCRWKREYEGREENTFPGNGNKYVEDEEKKQLKKELAEVKLEKDILKKTLSIVT